MDGSGPLRGPKAEEPAVSAGSPRPDLIKKESEGRSSESIRPERFLSLKQFKGKTTNLGCKNAGRGCFAAARQKLFVQKCLFYWSCGNSPGLPIGTKFPLIWFDFAYLLSPLDGGGLNLRPCALWGAGAASSAISLCFHGLRWVSHVKDVLICPLLPYVQP